MCPHCGQVAPIVYRGVAAYCSGCGRQRPPLIAPSVSYAGKPSKVGGAVAGIAGWSILAMGLGFAVLVGAIVGWIASAVMPGLIAAGILGLPAVVVATVLLLSGHSLRQSGARKQRETWREAIFALAANRQGAVYAFDASRSLGVSPAEADAFLTELAKTQPEDVTVEIDDAGGIYYAFPRLSAMRPRQRVAEPRVRVEGVPDTIDVEGVEYEETTRSQKGRQR